MARAPGLQRALLIVLLVTLGAAAAASIALMFLARRGDLEDRILLTALALGGFSLTGMADAVRFGRRRFVLLGVAGVAVSVAGLALAVLHVWDVVPPDRFAALKPMLSLIVLAGAMAWASVVLLAHGRSRGVDVVALATVGAILMLAGLLVAGILTDVVDPPRVLVRATGALGVLALLGTLMAPILVRMRSLGARSPESRGRHRLERAVGVVVAPADLGADPSADPAAPRE